MQKKKDFESKKTVGYGIGSYGPRFPNIAGGAPKAQLIAVTG